nr:MAG TPA: hypothetical protein [Caudoviricetes sp.]
MQIGGEEKILAAHFLQDTSTSTGTTQRGHTLQIQSRPIK